MRPQAVVSGGGGPYLHVVDGSVYHDWETVYRDNVDRLYRLMYARVGNRPDAEDLTSEVFSTALRPMRLPTSKGEARSYLLLTAKTVLASHWRRRLGQPVTTIDPDTDVAYLAEASGIEQPSDAPARAGKILGGLPERYRRILELRFLEACSIKEAAHTMSITVSNAKVLQHRALKMAANLAAEMDL
ncbi:MAG TPA: sigma-70 family RNA polymerase sigma factor [Jatrophihabitans sp.]